MPKVSVIMPCFNVEKYIERCLDSLEKQTLQDIEILCIDDKSTDDTLSIIKAHAKKDKRIRVIEHKVNSGVSVARNSGLRVAKGEYIGFVDPDDYIDEDFFEVLYTSAIESDADISKGKLQIKWSDGTVSEMLPNKNITGLYDFTVTFSSAIYKASLLNKHKILFPDNAALGEDVVFLSKSVCCANKFVKSDKVSYWYIRHADSASSSAKFLSDEIVSNSLNAYQDLLKWAINKNINDNKAKKYISYQCYQLVEWLFGTNISTENKTRVLESLTFVYKNALDTSLIDKRQKHSVVAALKKNNIHKLFLKFYSSYKRVYIFGLIPIIKIVKYDLQTYYLLFDFLPLLKVCRDHNKTKYYLFGFLDIVQIKG